MRNVCRSHDDSVVRQFGRVALFEATEFGAFQALRLREKHGEDVQVERTVPFNEFDTVRSAVRDAAAAYESRDRPSLPYEQFRDGTAHPSPGEMKEHQL